MNTISLKITILAVLFYGSQLSLTVSAQKKTWEYNYKFNGADWKDIEGPPGEEN